MSEDWVEATLGDACTLITDGSHFSPETEREGIPYVTVRDVHNGQIHLDTAARIGIDSFEQLAKNGCQPLFGDVLFSKDGTVGRIALVQTHEPFVVLSSLAILRADETVLSPAFLALCLSGPVFQSEATGQKTGLAIKRVVLKNLKQISIPAPPLPVQRRIVDLMTHLDAHIANLQAERDAVGALLHSARDTLLTRDETWTEVRLIELTTKIGSGATPRGGESTYRADGVALIRSQNIYDLLFEWEGLAHIGPEQARLLDGVEVKPEDLLLSITGASVNRCCQVPSEVLPARVNQHVAILRCDPSLVIPRFLMHMLRRSDIKSALDTLAEAGSTRQALTKAQIEQFKVSIPDNQTQERAVLALDLLSSHLTILNDEISCTEQTRTGLLASLLSGKQRLDITYDPTMAKAI